MAFQALKAHYSSTGMADVCGPLSASPDSDIFVGGACRKVAASPATWALLFYSAYTCGAACPAGTCGLKLLAHMREPASAPLVGQVRALAQELPPVCHSCKLAAEQGGLTPPSPHAQVYQNTDIAPSIVVASALGRRRLQAATLADSYVGVECPAGCPACACATTKSTAGGGRGLGPYGMYACPHLDENLADCFDALEPRPSELAAATNRKDLNVYVWGRGGSGSSRSCHMT